MDIALARALKSLASRSAFEDRVEIAEEHVPQSLFLKRTKRLWGALELTPAVINQLENCFELGGFKDRPGLLARNGGNTGAIVGLTVGAQCCREDDWERQSRARSTHQGHET